MKLLLGLVAVVAMIGVGGVAAYDFVTGDLGVLPGGCPMQGGCSKVQTEGSRVPSCCPLSEGEGACPTETAEPCCPTAAPCCPEVKSKGCCADSAPADAKTPAKD